MPTDLTFVAVRLFFSWCGKHAASVSDFFLVVVTAAVTMIYGQ